MNARTHIQLLKKVAVNERDMFEWHYLLEGPDGFSLFICMHMHMYITSDTNKQFLSCTLPLCAHYRYQLSLLILYQLFFLILSVYNVRYTVCGRMVPREAKVPARIPLRTARHHGACALLVLIFMRASSYCRDTVQLTHTRMRASLLI